MIQSRERGPGIKNGSPWLDDSAYRPRPQLLGKMDVDTVIIGGGITGMSAAYRLSKRGAGFVLVEKAEVGSGSTGRSSGVLSTGLEMDMEAADRQFGAAAAQEILKWSRGKLAELERIIKENGIKCGMSGTDALYVAVRKSHTKRFVEEASAASAAGMQAIIIPKESLGPAKGNAYGAILYKDYGATADPVKLVRGLASVVDSMLVGKIFENTCARGMARMGDGRYRITTDKGEIIGKNVIMALEASDTDLHVSPRSMVKVRVSSIATEPVGLDRLRKAGLAIGNARIMFDTRRVYTFIRVTDDWRVIVDGGDRVDTGRSGGVDSEVEGKAIDMLLESLRSLFPGLGEVKVEYAWQGNIGMNPSRQPAVGRVSGNVYGAWCFEGHGIVMGFASGTVMADLAIAGGDAGAVHGGAEMLRRFAVKNADSMVQALKAKLAQPYFETLRILDKFS